ncbi:hypothetical protein EF903_23185 [Streptomyces sp. WAC05292]|uniref:hypothetical protein n=1 Tax=Streptomyces sp. WAC05292 TaxID=2487418 RepID=UPI000F746FBD|nr:hypothetical protein [Streptomyces sp. WAC05292]RSS84761.1 hypothetical protein EF903_23185 [Streptomyces sp. WAC05292]
MRRGSSAVSAAALPGVRLWTGRVLEDLRAGRSCLCMLPRTPAGGAGAAAVLDELLHELGDFVLLPAPGPADAADPGGAGLPGPPAAAAPPAGGPWSDTAPVLDYDDGLSAFGARPRGGGPAPPAAVSTAGREAAAAHGRRGGTGGGPEPGAGAAAPPAGGEVPLAHGRADGTRKVPGTAAAAPLPDGEPAAAHGPADGIGREPEASAGSAGDAEPAPSAAGRPPERGWPTAHELADRVLKELGDAAPGADGGPGAGVDGLLHRLTDGSGAASRVIVVRGWHEPAPAAAAELLRRLAAAVKAAGLPPERRPRLLVLAGPSGLAAELPEQVAREDVAVHWWWGVHGRLDTATVVAMARPPAGGRAARHQLLEAVAQATVVEVCGPFLDLAERLAAEWDGRPDTLPPQLHRLLSDEGLLPGAREADDAVRSLPAQRRPAPGAALPAPAGALREDWDRGLADRWDGRLRHWPGAAARPDPRTRETGAPKWDWEWEHGVRTRIWLAQNTALLPLLDEAREAFTEVVRGRSRLPLPELAARYGPRRDGAPGPRPGTAAAPASAAALAGMELGDMWRAYVQGAARLSQPEADRLRTLWRSRNSLSHREALDSPRLERLADHLTR